MDPPANSPFLQRLHFLETRTTAALMKLNDDSHNTTIIQWSGKLINASSLLPLMTCENKAIKGCVCVYFGQSNRLIRAGWLVPSKAKAVTEIAAHVNPMSLPEVKVFVYVCVCVQNFPAFSKYLFLYSVGVLTPKCIIFITIGLWSHSKTDGNFLLSVHTLWLSYSNSE